jgi:Kdo2-lipid IVA lauroyltransferase/acyltransferase
MYYILYSFLYLISLLPLRVLYFISDGIYFLIYYIIGYRKKVVLNNIVIAFPEKTEKERIRIAKNFYHKFIDSLIETLKLLSASDSFFKKRFTADWNLIDRYYDQNKAVQIHLGHNFNWEWGNVVIAKMLRYPILAVYMPLSNKIFNRLFLKIRSRSGSHLLSALNMSNDFLPFRGQKYCLGLVADQSPGKLFKAKWFDFFGRKTAFTIGPAKNAIRNDTVVLFVFVERLKRGYYNMNISVAEEHPGQSNEDELTLKFVKYLEYVIRKNPDMWLWSHRRWKHEWKEGDVYVTDATTASKI